MAAVSASGDSDDGGKDVNWKSVGITSAISALVVGFVVILVMKRLVFVYVKDMKDSEEKSGPKYEGQTREGDLGYNAIHLNT